MSYSGDDKWEIYGEDISEYSGTLKELKEILINHIKKFYIGKMVNQYKEEEYEITKVSITIKKRE